MKGKHLLFPSKLLADIHVIIIKRFGSQIWALQLIGLIWIQIVLQRLT